MLFDSFQDWLNEIKETDQKLYDPVLQYENLCSAGYADPWSLRPTLPLSWTALRTGPWRNRTVAVPFPRYNAVLVVIN